MGSGFGNVTGVRQPIEYYTQIKASIALPTLPNAPSRAHLQGIQSQHTKANLAKKPAMCQRTAHRLPADEYLSSFVLHFNKIALNTKAQPPRQLWTAGFLDLFMEDNRHIKSILPKNYNLNKT